MKKKPADSGTGSSRLLAAALIAVSSPGSGDVAARVDARMTELFPDDEPGAVALISHGEAVLIRKAWGLADLEHAVPMTADAVFHLASVSKLFTTTGVLKLVESDELSLDHGVEGLLPAQAGARIHVRHLLTHTSGIPEYLDRPDARAWIRTELTLDGLIASFAERPLDFEPGTHAAYSNSNYALLAALEERASERPFAIYLQENVFDPAAMTSTLCGGRSEIIPRRALGYELHEDGFRNEKFYSMSILTGTSGVLSSAEDLLRFFRALFAQKLISREMLELSSRPARLATGERTGFGMGWEINRVRGKNALMKGGAISGFTHYVLALPEEELFVILLTNRAADGERRMGLLCLQFAELALSESMDGD